MSCSYLWEAGTLLTSCPSEMRRVPALLSLVSPYHKMSSSMSLVSVTLSMLIIVKNVLVTIVSLVLLFNEISEAKQTMSMTEGH